MKKCYKCVHYQFEREVFLYDNAPPTGCGYCTRGQKKRQIKYPGCRVFGVDEACALFDPVEELKYGLGDVFAGENEAVYIERIDEELYPRIYRVRTTRHGGYSLTEEELDADYRLIWSKEKRGVSE